MLELVKVHVFIHFVQLVSNERGNPSHSKTLFIYISKTKPHFCFVLFGHTFFTKKGLSKKNKWMAVQKWIVSTGWDSSRQRWAMMSRTQKKKAQKTSVDRISLLVEVGGMMMISLQDDRVEGCNTKSPHSATNLKELKKFLLTHSTTRTPQGRGRISDKTRSRKKNRNSQRRFL